MLKRIAQSALIVLFVLWTTIASWQSSQISLQPSGQEHTATEQHAANKERENRNRDKAQSLWIPTDSVGLYTLVLAVFTGLLVCVSGFQGYFLLRADKTARIVADAASLNARAALRAEQSHVYPVIEDESIVQMVKLWGRSGNSPDSTKDEIQGMGVSYRLKNYGKTPAIIRIAAHELVHAFRPPKDESKIVAFLEVDKILGPEESTETMVCSLHPQRPFSVADAMSVLRGKTTIWFHGFVTYDDLFGFERHLEFTWWYNGSLGRFGWYSFKGSEKPKEI
jgi:hypothetical protein